MTIQPYCLVDITSNVCDNLVLWDGDSQTWAVPETHLALPQNTTPSKVWVYDDADKVWLLSSTVGEGQIGFTWDGSSLVTDQPMPTSAPQVTVHGLAQPSAEGAQTL